MEESHFRDDRSRWKDETILYYIDDTWFNNFMATETESFLTNDWTESIDRSAIVEQNRHRKTDVID